MIGFLIIATGDYIKYVRQLVDSIEKFCSLQYEIYLFTDNKNYKDDRVVKIDQKHLGFPSATLYRYHIFLENQHLLKTDYLYYIDVDMKIVDTLDNEILGDLVGTLHPGYTKSVGTYEKRKQSTAYVDKGQHYFCGGFNGGKREKYLEMAITIRKNIDLDNINGIIAVWHDESHLNRYFLDNPPTKILSPSYCYPEVMIREYDAIRDIKPKIIALKK